MRVGRSALLIGAAGLLACGGRQPSAGTGAPGETVVNQVLPLDRLYVLEVAGVPPGDTAVTFAAGTARSVILRHGPPDNNVFAELIFPASSGEIQAAPDSVRLSLRPRPGVYGLEIGCNRPLEPGARLIFKYPVHFSAPIGAQQRYGTSVLFERALVIARLEPDGRYLLLPSSRPAADNLQTALTETGTYLVVAPR